MISSITCLLKNLRLPFFILYIFVVFLFQANRMDVVWGETAGVDGQLWLLCPILFIMQVIRKHFDIVLKD